MQLIVLKFTFLENLPVAQLVFFQLKGRLAKTDKTVQKNNYVTVVMLSIVVSFYTTFFLQLHLKPI